MKKGRKRGITVNKIARDLGVSWRTVRIVLAKGGRDPNKISEEDAEWVKRALSGYEKRPRKKRCYPADHFAKFGLIDGRVFPFILVSGRDMKRSSSCSDCGLWLYEVPDFLRQRILEVLGIREKSG